MHCPGHGQGLVKTWTGTIHESERIALLRSNVSKVWFFSNFHSFTAAKYDCNICDLDGKSFIFFSFAKARCISLISSAVISGILSYIAFTSGKKSIEP